MDGISFRYSMSENSINQVSHLSGIYRTSASSPLFSVLSSSRLKPCCLPQVNNFLHFAEVPLFFPELQAFQCRPDTEEKGSHSTLPLEFYTRGSRELFEEKAPKTMLLEKHDFHKVGFEESHQLSGFCSSSWHFS